MKNIITSVLIIVAWCHSIAQTKKYPCPKYQDVVEDYSSSKPNYHIYTVKDFVIVDLKEYPKASKSLVYQVMLSNAIAVAPGTVNASIIDCGELDVPPFGTVVTKIIPADFTVTNYTRADHYLANGKVTRHIMQMGTKIFVRTTGVGNNQNPFWKVINGNQAAADYIWANPNAQLKVKTLQLLNELAKDALDRPTNETQGETSSVEQEKKSLKEVVRGFLKWTENVWEKKNIDFNFVLNKYGKTEKSGDNCPCTLNEKAVTAYIAWMQAKSPFMSALYFENYNKELLQIEKQFNSANSSESIYGAVENAYVSSYPIYVGNAGTPDFAKLGFYTDTDKVKWKINIQQTDRAIVDIAYRGSDYEMRIEMIKESGSWKLTKPVRSNYINDSFTVDESHKPYKYALFYVTPNNQLALLGKYPIGIKVAVLNHKTGETLLCKTTSVKNYKNEFTADNVIATELDKKPAYTNPDDIYRSFTAILDADKLGFQLINKTLIEDEVKSQSIDNKIKQGGYLEKLLKQYDQTKFAEGYLKILKSKTPVIYNLKVSGIDANVVTYMLSKTEVGPRLLMMNSEIIPLSGQCSFSDFYFYKYGYNYFIKTNSAACESGYIIAEIFEVRKNSVIKEFSNSGYSN